MKNYMRNSHLEMHHTVLHVSFTIVIDGIGQITEAAFSTSLMADCTVNAFTFQLTN